MVTEKDLTQEQKMAISLAIDTMDRNINRYFNRVMVCNDVRVSYGKAINILADMIAIKEPNIEF